MSVFFASFTLSAKEREQIILNDHWHIKQLEPGKYHVKDLIQAAVSPDESWYATRVPAQVHDVLFEYDKIPDPRIDKNAAKCTWVAEKDWAYTCTFETPEQNQGPVLLRFYGLDVLADAFLNGQKIGFDLISTGNPFFYAEQTGWLHAE